MPAQKQMHKQCCDITMILIEEKGGGFFEY